MWKDFDIPSEEQLKNVSFETSLGKSTNKLAITEDIIKIVKSDAHTYESVANNEGWLSNYCYRIKTPDSIDRKVNRHPNLRFQSVFNDILGIRIKVNNYPDIYPDYFRVVDMRNGKAADDGYRAVHLYYKLSNYHYPIEIQLWGNEDYEFNDWTHMYAYKTLSDEKLLLLYDMYKKGVISNKEAFRKEVLKLCQR
jgi:putative GTP pyrophosphokinase